MVKRTDRRPRVPKQGTHFEDSSDRRNQHVSCGCVRSWTALSRLAPSRAKRSWHAQGSWNGRSRAPFRRGLGHPEGVPRRPAPMASRGSNEASRPQQSRRARARRASRVMPALAKFDLASVKFASVRRFDGALVEIEEGHVVAEGAADEPGAAQPAAGNVAAVGGKREHVLCAAN